MILVVLLFGITTLGSPIIHATSLKRTRRRNLMTSREPSCLLSKLFKRFQKKKKCGCVSVGCVGGRAVVWLWVLAWCVGVWVCVGVIACGRVGAGVGVFFFEL